MKYIDIYECLIKHYPLGINELEPIYQEYSGYKLLQELCYNKLSPVKSSQWGKLISDLESSYPSIICVKDETESIEPSYSCSLTLFRNRTNNIIHQKEVRLHVSVLNNFYTVYGLDAIYIYDAHNSLVMETEPILSVSPIGDYIESIPLVRNIIENTYADFKYVPFYYLRKRVKALSVAGAETTDLIEASIFQALFTNEDLTRYKFKGDVYYE